MSRDTSLPVRRAILTALKADADVVALVPADRLFPPQVPGQPAWPFGRYGATTQLPLRASGLDGSRVIGAMHGFARGPGEDEVSKIAAAFAAVLDGLTTPLDTPWPATMTVKHTGTQILQDAAEAGAWHAVVNFEANVSS